jgi:hypothetical protein
MPKTLKKFVFLQEECMFEQETFVKCARNWRDFAKNVIAQESCVIAWAYV